MGPMQQSPCVPFYPYTMFENPMSKPSCQKSRKTIITQKVLVIQNSHIVHCDQHSQKAICADFQAFSNTFSLCKLIWFSFLSGGVKQTATNCTFCWFWLGKMNWNGLSGAYLGFEVCGIQWYRLWVSVIRCFWEITISGKTFIFWWFWLGKMHPNSLSGTCLGFEVCWIQWYRFWVSMIRCSWEITISGKNFTFVDFDWVNCIQMAWVMHI